MTGIPKGDLILNATQIDQKVKRMAFEVLERNFKEEKIILAGICGQGEVLAKKLQSELQEITDIDIFHITINLDKSHPSRGNLTIDGEKNEIKNNVVIIIDDVLNTGKTLAYSLRPFLEIKNKKIEVAVLVNRDHTSFPISPQYTGYELSTTLSEHIIVDLDAAHPGVYLQ